ncbi:cilia- and flagella-associated protein 45 [Lampris incognitus]|uniref:cilia- and flagella-associated protein 45 n=1 Tax=Lampris incognitus TaxID=2546036 RepID=UPI0024B61346|nr:cilia- and flagella-associated protein 45 [Lampris incognitus]
MVAVVGSETTTIRNRTQHSPQQISAAREALTSHSGSSAPRLHGRCLPGRYRTRFLPSVVEESLFGLPKLQTPLTIKQSEKWGKPVLGARDQSRSAPQQRSQPAETVRIITKDLIRDLKIPREDPSGLSIILSAAEIKRIRSASRVLTEEERETMMEAFQKKKEEAMYAAEERKAQIRQADLSRKKNQALSELEAEAQHRAQYLLERANAIRMEQEDEVKKLNKLILDAQCHTMRDTQILEKRKIQAELLEEERRLDAMMEVNRRNAIEAQEQIDELRKQQRISGKQQIVDQMEERLEERLLQDELKEQEGQQIVRNLERIQQEELEALERRREEQKCLQQEIMRINAETLQAKERRRAEEALADLRAMEYTHKKMEREAEFEAEQRRIKREKEKEVARLRALQERERDYKAEQDELRAKRNQEATEREWRRKEKERAEKKAQEDAMLKAARLEQVAHKEHLLSMEAGRERAEFERVLKAQQEAIAKQKAEEEKQQQRALGHAEAVRLQVKERELMAVAKRRDFFKEGDQLDEEARHRRIRLDEIKRKKLMELKAAGLPEKYYSKVERKAFTLPALIH